MSRHYELLIFDWEGTLMQSINVLQGKVYLFAGVNEMLIDLKRQGYKLAVATGALRSDLDKLLIHTELTSVFDVTRCASETKSKPNPLMLDQILTETSTSSDNALMIGDTEGDLIMAQAANMDAIGIASESAYAAAMQLYNPVAIFNGVTELQTWLEANNTRV